MIRRGSAIILIALFMTSCGIGGALTAADDAVRTFHGQLDEGRYEEIYETGHDALRSGGTQADFVKFLSTVHDKLGNVKNSTRQTWRVFYGPQGKLINVVYDTTFASGSGTETFSYLCVENGVVLHGYNITSNDLITK